MTRRGGRPSAQPFLPGLFGRRRTAAAPRPYGAENIGLDQCRARLSVGMVLAGLVFCTIAGRLIDLGALNEGAEPRASSTAAAGSPTSGPIVGRRDIVDRNGVLLASTLPMIALAADPKEILDPADTATKLGTVFPDLDVGKLKTELASDKSFIWIRRTLTPRQHDAVNRLGLPGLEFRHTERRLYPHGNMMVHILGATDIDNAGISGFEKSFDLDLRRGDGPVALSIDVRLQNILHEELSKKMQEFQAIGAGGAIMDVATGEVLALASLPDYDPHGGGRISDEARFNRVTLGVYELGSVFKIFNTAMALESGKVAITDRFDTMHAIKVGRFSITDYHPENHPLTVPEIFLHSSNIGSALMAEKVGTATQRAFLGSLNLLTKPSFEVPELGRPLVPSPWRDISTLTVSYGHGIAVTPLQMIAATAAMVNGGILHAPTLMKLAAPPAGKRVISPRTSDLMRRLMRIVVTEGTARMAEVKGYVVGGKTGTADKAMGRKYSENAKISSFIGAFPIHAPRYLVFVMLDEPKPTKATHGFATAGWTAAPAVAEIVQKAAPLLGILPVDDTDPAIQKALDITISPDKLAPNKQEGGPNASFDFTPDDQ
jgi:cell division protein FtsI (penicillin-binding protein 3)